MKIIIFCIGLFAGTVSQNFGCAIVYAENYDMDADGCENGSLDCCQFNCTLEYPAIENLFYNAEDCNDEDNWDKLNYPDNYLRDRIQNILNNQNQATRDLYEFPLVFHDVYGEGYLEEFDEFRAGINEMGELNRSLCTEIVDMETCECLGFRAVQILNEQYSNGNIGFYRACTDTNGKLLTSTECNAGYGELIGFQLLEDFISQDLNNMPGHPELDENEGWSNYINNAINIYITECIQFNRFGENCYSSLNGFANRGSYGSQLHRGLAVRQDAFFTKYSDRNEIKNYSTVPHELGHTFNLNHVWYHNNSCGYVDYDPNGEQCLLEADMICDTEAAPCDGFAWQRSAFWKNDNDQVFCSFIGQSIYPTGIHGCGEVPNEELRSRGVDNESGNYLVQGVWQNVFDVNTNISENITAVINPVQFSHAHTENDSIVWHNQISDAHDTLGRTYGTRDIEQYWDQQCEEWVIDDFWSSVENETFHPAPIHNFMANKNVSHCRNLGCSSIEPLCTPLSGFTEQQFNAARYDIEFYLFGCMDPIAENYNPNAVINDESCVYFIIGDPNQDGIINVLDIVLMVNGILELSELTEEQIFLSDVNSDNNVNITDIVILVNLILGE